ncbi:hypothetical protein K493DRAFT_358722 [Basidiobolus meristosporus CBS 931.73]|uniref:SCP2 domain-containing protein n=1 Tax=Basidiobolus meristosporus CBS 931.73 TaxID=1314790 RepID=A0A1Y1XU96_9FUNG|nr:hypothetical protein K493DRAFT_358722 [Basidiobolus meristosporus CBS 931.73]|eukprot:ORX89066.1 hypothetical protein K493DRAFT_358722 [Basidiobolus meristosporus CBS 931.73]
MSQESPLMADLLLPAFDKEFKTNPDMLGNMQGLFIVVVTRKGQKRAEWYILLRGWDQNPEISKTRPSNVPVKTTGGANFPSVRIELEDRDLVNLATGGLNGIKGYVTGRLKIQGDLILSQQFEEIFKKAGGVEKTMALLARWEQNRRGKL